MIESVVKILKALNIIEIDDKNIITMVTWGKYKNIEGMEKVGE
ncbi:phage replisome organizer N-terminal domain-containing protein [Clostridium saccharoperbutylacetonicum]